MSYFLDDVVAYKRRPNDFDLSRRRDAMPELHHFVSQLSECSVSDALS